MHAGDYRFGMVTVHYTKSVNVNIVADLINVSQGQFLSGPSGYKCKYCNDPVAPQVLVMQ